MTTRDSVSTNSRSTSNRESNQRRVVFEEPNWLDIPATVKERFAREGNVLRWLRILINGNDDYQNIGKRTAEGWVLVNKDEVPEMLASSFVREGGRYNGAVCRGDLVLAKMPAELAQSRQEFYENRSREMVDAVNSQLMSENNSRMPIHNNSKTQVSRGKVPKFQE